MSLGPMGIASQALGLPMGKSAKKSTHRGRKPSGKPGASHLAALQAAHGSGDLGQAKTHALNYAKAIHTAMKPTMPGPIDEADTMGAPDEQDPQPMTMAKPASNPAQNRLALAKLAMSRRPK